MKICLSILALTGTLIATGGCGDAEPLSLCDGCDPNAACRENEGVCTCPPGTDDPNGDGSVCSDIDECTNGTHNCADNATCLNFYTSFGCECNDGFRGDGTECFENDECTNGVANCDDLAECTDLVNDFSCSCSLFGLVDTNGDGTACDPPANSGVCLVFRSRAGPQHVSDPPLVVGSYAMQFIPGVNTINGLEASCSAAIYTDLTASACTSNAPFPSLAIGVMTFDSNGDTAATACETLDGECYFLPCRLF